MKRLCILFCFLSLMLLPVSAEPIKWVDFDVPYESMKYAMEEDIRTFEQEKHLNWIDILCVAACRTGGKCGLKSVQKAAADLKGDRSPQELVGELSKYYDYYHEAYTAVLGGLSRKLCHTKGRRLDSTLWIESVFSHCGGLWLQPL